MGKISGEMMEPSRNNAKTDRKQPGRRDPKQPRRVTRDYLMNYATWYLERFTASRARLEKLMRHKIRLSAAEHGTDPQEAEDWMRSVLDTCTRAGFIDDRAYALGRARSQLRKGKALRMIGADLAARGIDADLIDTALSGLHDAARQAATGPDQNDPALDPNLAAAAVYARRRRLGPFRNTDNRAERRDRDLAALARQGFAYDIATRIIDADLHDLDELLQMIDGV
ncbi:MAG: RecX family transcriptional regulator [Pseudomonadota bacterium]